MRARDSGEHRVRTSTYHLAEAKARRAPLGPCAERPVRLAGHPAVHSGWNYAGPSRPDATVECADSASEGWNMPASTSRYSRLSSELAK